MTKPQPLLLYENLRETDREREGERYNVKKDFSVDRPEIHPLYDSRDPSVVEQG